jgi:type II secretory pathway component PulJ
MHHLGVDLMGFDLKRKRINQAFTLVELLLSVTVSSLVLIAIAYLEVQQLRIADTIYASTTVDRRFRRLSDLLKIEIGQACLLRGDGDGDPRTPSNSTITLPDSACKPLATSNCTSLGQNTTGMRLLIPITSSTNTVSYNIVRYYLSGNEVHRLGPQIGKDGLLDISHPNVDTTVLTNVSAFKASVSLDCTNVSLTQLALNVPGSSQTSDRSNQLTFYSGASQGIN